ncbi:hypothetical protein [Paenibacillus xylaniclasticus]|uniref:hypothetical protein n=1 Tax=Paenibacillus xylaniclasticus TaxID=588083 RepID=UPI000FD812B9|nr:MULTISPECIES: hypothetical protein [Paenibacillus]GFN33215.1 hypothetical protein PCURB6_34750 [Paenibacillus curdlanolyticus]
MTRWGLFDAYGGGKFGGHWFAFDVFGSSNQPSEVLFPRPYSEILSTDELIKKAKEIVQFHSGVFIRIRKGKEIGWEINTLPETEESEGLQHPEAEIEIRPLILRILKFTGWTLLSEIK